MSKLIYLDSNDFSDLATPSERISLGDAATLKFLKELKQAGCRFLLSPIHLSEGVHAAARFKESAVRRADLMRDLCDSNFAIYPTTLCEREINKLIAGENNPRLSVSEFMSKEDEWFGFPIDVGFFETKRDARAEIDKQLQALPRRERRRMRSMLDLGKKSSHENWRALIQAGTQKSISELPLPLSLVPQAETIDWFLGIKPDSEYRLHLLRIMKNPLVLFSYIVDQADHRDVLYKIARDSGANLQAGLAKVCESVVTIVTLGDALGTPFNSRTLTDAWFESSNITRRLIDMFAGTDAHKIDDRMAQQVLDLCPAISTLIKAFKAYLYGIIDAQMMRVRAGNPTPLSLRASDFGDLLHCVYAPYVDVFRCDARFGAILKQNPGVRPVIFNRRTELEKLRQSDVAA